jgi:fatty acid-binding protein DegV
VIKAANIARDFIGQKERIEVYDSFSGSMGTGFLAITAAKAVMREEDFADIIDSLDYLKKT